MSNGKTKWVAASICLAILGTSARGEDAAAEAKMGVIASGAMKKMGGYRPHQLKMSAEKPAGLKKAPELAAPLYGSIEFGGASYLMAIDEPEGKDAKLFVDANANGDLTDDPATVWAVREIAMPNGKKTKQYSGSFKLPLATGDKPEMVSLGAYRFDKDDPQRAPLKDTFLYYSDYAYEGDVTLSGKTYHAMLTDDLASGDFRGDTGGAKKAAAGPAGSGIRLMIDVNGDGKFDSRGEMFDAAKPFNVKGTSWKLSDMTAGGSFKIAKSDEAVAEVLPPPDHSVGKKITPFKATRTDGTAVNFPADYKGRIVMLDFWATWCGPCMGEVPGLVKSYEEFHPKGLEILGISLDQPNAADKVKTVTADKGMTWPQVYDGKFWKAEVADLYGIHSIPAAFLVDGDTGAVLAEGGSLRGDQLAPTVKAALEKKGGPK
ncbi:MAG: thioredoxin family protein [Phycisphaerales bacterium]|nr:thioredoxin family protein [Phycisphaerales bacterium]